MGTPVEQKAQALGLMDAVVLSSMGSGYPLRTIFLNLNMKSSVNVCRNEPVFITFNITNLHMFHFFWCLRQKQRRVTLSTLGDT